MRKFIVTVTENNNDFFHTAVFPHKISKKSCKSRNSFKEHYRAKRRTMMPTISVKRAVKVLLFFFFFSLTTTFVFADDENNDSNSTLMNSKNEAAHQLPLITTTTTTEKEEDNNEEEEREAEVGKREKRDDERGEGQTKKTFNIFSGPAYQGCCPNSSSLLSCCEEEGGCCSKTGTTGTLLDCCFSNPMDEVDLTEDKEEEEEEERKQTNPEEEGAQVETTLTNQQNDDDISEDEREDVESLVEATTYWPGGNRRFTWENLNVPMPSAVKKIIAEKKETEEERKEEKGVQEEINTNAAPTGQEEEEEEETRKTFKTLLDISSFKMSKNEVLQGALGFGIFVIVASYIVGATYTREDGREISGNARGWSGVRQERESLYDSAFKAYASV